MVDALNSDDTADQVVDLDNSATVDESEGGGEGEATAAPEVIETVIEETGAQPGPVATQGGVNRLLRKLGKANAAKRDVEGDLERERQRAQMLEIALQQERETKAGPPDPSTFDDGISDPKYIEAQTSYIAQEAAKAVRKDLPAPVRAAPNANFQHAQQQHVERAEKLGIKDYAAVQDDAIDALGGEISTQIINASPKSEVLMYFFGKNPEKAEAIRSLVDSGVPEDAVKATLEIGRLEERLHVRSKAATQPAPDPDEELPGSSPSGSARRGPKGAKFE